MSQAAHEPSDRLRGKVEALVAYGMPQDVIAKELGISKTTLIKYYAAELENGKPKMLAKVASTLFRLAVGDPANGIDPHPASCMFILKCQAGWRETSRHELTGADGGAVKHEHSVVESEVDLDKLSPQARLEMLEQLEANNAARAQEDKS